MKNIYTSYKGNEITIEKDYHIFIPEILKGKQSSVLKIEGNSPYLHKDDLNDILCRGVFLLHKRNGVQKNLQNSPKFTKDAI